MRRRSCERVAAVTAAATFIAFFPALRDGFVGWDDHLYIVHNAALTLPAGAFVRWAFTTMFFGNYQPLAWLALRLERAAAGLDPAAYHLTSVAFHALNAALAYVLIRRLLALARPRDGERERAAAACFGALFWAAHPLRVESVAWLSDQREVIAGALALGSLLLYLDAQAERGRRRAARLAAAWACFSLSLLSKISAWMLPAGLLVLDAYPLRRPLRRDVWLEKLAFAAACAPTFLATLIAQQRSGAVSALGEYGPLHRLAQSVYDPAFYLYKTVVPTGLSPLYERSLVLEPGAFVLAGAATLSLCAAAFALRRRAPGLAAAWTWWLLMLAPTLGFVKLGRWVAADRYTYLPSLALAVLAAAALAAALRRAETARPALGAAGLVVIGLGLTAARQTAVWRDSLSLWSRVVEAQPRSFIARFNLATALGEAGRADESRAERLRAYETAIGVFREASERLEARGDREGAARRAAQAERLERELAASRGSGAAR